jgi:hypothetical protein
MKKIRISASWDTSEKLTERLLKEFKTPEIDLSNVEFVYDDSYDVIVFFNHVVSNIVQGSKSYVFPHEPSWSGTHQKNFKDGTTILGFDEKLYEGNCIETLAHTFYGGRGPWVDPIEFWCYNNLKDKTFVKTKNISSSITELRDNMGETCLYPQRYIISKMTQELSFVDFFGGGDCSPKRHDALIDYRFNIAIENEHQNNWITEKFYDSILTDTIPIYFGCKNIKDIYPEDGYILIDDINDFDGIEKILRHINENSEEIYNQKIVGARKIKERYFKEYNLLKKIITL